MWSFGIVLLELAKGKAPLSHCSFTKIIIDTVHGPAPSLESGSSDKKFSKVASRKSPTFKPGWMSNDCRGVQVWQVAAAMQACQLVKCAGAEDVDACVQGLCSLVERCLNKDADNRPAASELLKDPIFK